MPLKLKRQKSFVNAALRLYGRSPSISVSVAISDRLRDAARADAEVGKEEGDAIEGQSFDMDLDAIRAPEDRVPEVRAHFEEACELESPGKPCATDYVPSVDGIGNAISGIEAESAKEETAEQMVFRLQEENTELKEKMRGMERHAIQERKLIGRLFKGAVTVQTQEGVQRRIGDLSRNLISGMPTRLGYLKSLTTMVNKEAQKTEDIMHPEERRKVEELVAHLFPRDPTVTSRSGLSSVAVNALVTEFCPRQQGTNMAVSAKALILF